MDLTNILNNNINNMYDDINKFISIKCYKQKNKYKTNVYGLDNFITDKELKTFTKIIKKKLGCSGTIYITDEKNKVLVFSGNKIKEIKNIIIENNITDATRIN